MTISQLDDSIKNRSNAGNRRFAVAIGGKHDYASEVVSTHRSQRAAQRALADDMHLWQWDSQMNPNGGYRIA